MAEKKRPSAKAPAKTPARSVRGRARDEAAFPITPPRADVPEDYAQALGEIKQRIRQERLRVVLSANASMVLLYWDLGRLILERQERAGWGAKVIDRLAADLRQAFPEMKGFSPRNLKYMRAFAAAWPDRPFVQQLAAQIPWSHNCLLLDRLADPKTREWYIKGASNELRATSSSVRALVRRAQVSPRPDGRSSRIAFRARRSSWATTQVGRPVRFRARGQDT